MVLSRARAAGARAARQTSLANTKGDESPKKYDKKRINGSISRSNMERIHIIIKVATSRSKGVISRFTME